MTAWEVQQAHPDPTNLDVAALDLLAEVRTQLDDGLPLGLPTPVVTA